MKIAKEHTMPEEIEMRTRSVEGEEVKEEDEDDEDEDEEEEDEEVEEFTNCGTSDNVGETEEEIPLWNYSRISPKADESISTADNKFIDTSILVMKLLAYLLTFSAVLFGAAFSKLGMLLMTSQLAPNKKVTLSQDNRFLQLEIPTEEKYLWIWALFIAYCGPEVATFVRSFRQIMFKSHTMHEIEKDGQRFAFAVAFFMETLHVIGMSIFVFEVLPRIDSVRGVMLTNCVCLTPAILGTLSRDKYNWIVGVDLMAIMFQLSGFALWPVISVNGPRRLWFLPVALFLISCGWWMNFVSETSKFSAIKTLGKAKDKFKESVTLYRLYIWLSPYKMLVFGLTTCGILAAQDVDLGDFFSSFNSTFSNNRTMEAHRLEEITGSEGLYVPSEKTTPVKTFGVNVLWFIGFQMLCSYISYAFSKFSYKIMISSFSFALPVIFVVPVSVVAIITSSTYRNSNPGIFKDFLCPYVFFDLPIVYTAEDIFLDKLGILWILWLISQTWITRHVWQPKVERLSRTEKLFATPMFSNFLVDQSILLNRRRDKEDKKYTKKSSYMPHIIACATMWHETRPEMLEMLKSIMRMDRDQYVRRKGVEILKTDEETTCYTFETHVFFDDAFEVENEETGNMVINSFVRDLIQSVHKAKDAVYKFADVNIAPPRKTGTPYGGRLTYTLPYDTKMYVHLKNKDKIRHRKRWSQVMYMYYLLGYNIMQKEPMSVQEKLKKADNTFLLALDGDIDFKPEAVILLVDLMKKNSDLGAACGRIHPVGSGFMVWYQEFEYAIGHWLQKATEHMIGCVLCSPGCFSLFRAGALLAENVMKTYTTKAEEARHYVQYDQGEDRWLCTLLLQRGYRVEYSAASDAYTHCPESFNEFYTQRRRWVPSTMANILDLLCDYKNIVKVNNHISLLYISYQLRLCRKPGVRLYLRIFIFQFMLMIGTVLGPGTIFLLLVSAFNAAFRIDNWTSFLYNMIPIILYVIICLTMTGNIQLFSALLLSAVYGLIMMAVLVGMLMQISEDGYLAPSTIFLYIVAGEIIVAGLAHPQEILCLFRGPIYYVTIPSMYLLLIIYSVCNLNVVTWGTREVKQKRTKAELEEEKKLAEEEEKRKKKRGPFHSILGNLGRKKEGATEFSLGNLFKFMLCTKPKEGTQAKELSKINDSLEMVGKRLERLERGLELTPTSVPNRVHRSSSRTSFENVDSEGREATEKKDNDVAELTESGQEDEERDDLINPYWIEDEMLKTSGLDVLDMNETAFWKDLIKEYLYPLMEDKNKKEEISKALKELRDKVVMTFFMLNALFVIVVFLLQLNKSKIHVNWPVDAKINMTIYKDKTILVTKTYLELEPVGVLFIIFFAVILVIQFLAMILHRFETLCHLLSSATIFTNKKKKFESQLREGDKQFWQQNRETVSTFRGRKRTTLNVQEMTDRIFSKMKHEEELEMAQREEKRRLSMLRRFAQSALDTANPSARSRYSQFKNKLEQVIEEGPET